MRFLVDMPLSPRLATWLIDQGHDAVHAADLGFFTAADEVILDHVREERRVAVTADLDYPRMLAATQAQGPGLPLFRGGDYSERDTVERLSHVLKAIPEDQIEKSIAGC